VTAARMLMVQGTSSSVGKSLLVAGLCRIFARQGLRVAPFKAQNMSNNAAVCADGSEIGRAQALQAAAAGIAPTADMNPVLLKPEADCHSQVIVLGKVWKTLPARHYYERKQFLWSHVTGALERLRSNYDLIIAEGAGSPVELNLKSGDIVNMAIARHAEAPVLLVGDIDRGGVFAQLLGTLDLLSPEERTLVKGLIVNKFRGDPTLFVDGVRILQERGGVPVLGVVPYLANLDLPDEDAVAIESGSSTNAKPNEIEIAVIRLPHIANFDDFDPLKSEPGVRLRYVDSPSHLGKPHAVVLPGTKSTMSDLRWLRERGIGDAIVRLRDQGAAVVGICGGYQMLGTVVRDPQKMESDINEIPGLDLLPVDTEFAGQKATHQVLARVVSKTGWMARLSGISLTGYEIHMGRTVTSSRWLEINTRGNSTCLVLDGAASEDGQVWGCYLHGLFANDEFRRAWLSSLRADFRASPTRDSARLQLGLDRWADAVARALPVSAIEQIITEGTPR
jgi:adenosylcobyric acid synthase